MGVSKWVSWSILKLVAVTMDYDGIPCHIF